MSTSGPSREPRDVTQPDEESHEEVHTDFAPEENLPDTKISAIRRLQDQVSELSIMMHATLRKSLRANRPHRVSFSEISPVREPEFP